MKKMLNLGCGNDIREGFDNLDIQTDAPIVWDLNNFPYIFAKANTYEYVDMKAVLCLLNDPRRTLIELHHLCKNGALIKISVPYYNNKGAITDIDTKHTFSDATFITFVDNNCRINKKKIFEIEEMILTPTWIGKFIIFEWLRKKMSIFIPGLIGEIHVTLKVIKDSDERR